MRAHYWEGALVLIGLLAMALSGCQSGGKQGQSEFWGQTINGTYINPYFGFQAAVPAGWSVQDTATSEALARQMREQVMGSDSSSETPFAAQLVTAYKYPVGASVTYNPSAQVVAERIDVQAGITDGSMYLAGVQRLLEKTPLTYTFPESVYSTRLGNRDFSVLEANLHLEGLLARQMYYVTLEKGYALGFVLSFASKEQRDELEQQFLETVVFDK